MLVMMLGWHAEQWPGTWDCSQRIQMSSSGEFHEQADSRDYCSRAEGTLTGWNGQGSTIFNCIATMSTPVKNEKIRFSAERKSCKRGPLGEMSLLGEFVRSNALLMIKVCGRLVRVFELSI